MEMTRAAQLAFVAVLSLFCNRLHAQSPTEQRSPAVGAPVATSEATSAQPTSTQVIAASYPLPQAQFIANVDAALVAATPGVPEVSEQESLLLRKLYLCLIGMPPRLDELNAYLANTDPERFSKTVDDLLSRPEFVEHWAEKLDVMLMERRANTHVPQDQWMAWLRGQLSSGRPLNQLMADLLVADGSPGESRAVARFLLDRTGDPHLITKDVARIYFGRDIQCSQCHNHPTIDSYLQTDYHGLYGFVAGVHMVEVADGDKKVQVIAEKSASDAPFESVFRKGTMHRVLPSLFGDEELPQPWAIPGEEYHPTESGKPAKPIHSRRNQLADLIRNGNLEAFNRNIANRVWSIVFSRGIVEPVDLHHVENPPLSESLLDLVSRQFAGAKFDLREFVRCLVLTKAFRRGELDFSNSQNQELIAWLSHHSQQAESIAANTSQEAAQTRQARNAARDDFGKKLNEIADVQKQRVDALAAVDAARNGYAQTLDALKKANTEKASAEQALAVVQDKLAKLKAAADSGTAALQTIGQDAEVNAAVELFKNRLTGVQASFEPAQKLVSDKSAAAQAATDVSAKARETLVAAQSKAAEISASYRVAASAAQQVRQQAESLALKTALAETLENRTQKLIAWRKQSAELSQLIAAIEQKKVEVAQFKLNVQNLLASTEAAKQKLPELTALAETMVGQLNNKMQAVDELNGKVSRLIAAKDAIASTSNLVAEPESIKAAGVQIDASLASIREQISAVTKELVDIQAVTTQRQNALSECKKLIEELQVQSVASDRQLAEAIANQEKLASDLETSRQQLTKSAAGVGDYLAKRFMASQLRALSPEQIGWAFLSVNGVYKNYVDKHLAELEKAAPATPEQQNDATFVRQRRIEAVRKARAELQSNINQFVSLYGAGPGQPQNDFFATPDQALYANNGGALFAWASPNGENVAGKMLSAANLEECAVALYRGILCREPMPNEIVAVKQFLEQSPDQKARLIQEMVWSLMASAEFRFLP